MVDKDEVPAFELIVRARGSDIAVVAFFRRTDESMDAVVAVINPKDVQALEELCHNAAFAFASATGWQLLPLDADEPFPF